MFTRQNMIGNCVHWIHSDGSIAHPLDPLNIGIGSIIQTRINVFKRASLTSYILRGIVEFIFIISILELKNNLLCDQVLNYIIRNLEGKI